MADIDPSQNKPEPEFSIQRIYTKDLSFEAPHTPQIFQQEWKPELNVDLQTQATQHEENIHEVVLIVTVTVKSEEKVAFIAEIKQAGIFSIKNFPKEQLQPILGSMCPGIIYPYARELISDIVARGGFPPLYLAPISFDALYQQHQEEKEGKKASVKEEEDGHVH